MVRVGGLRYTCTPSAPTGQRISNMQLNGKPLDADKVYKVAGWASVAEGASGTPIWEVLESYLRAHPVVRQLAPQQPTLVGVAGNPGLA